MKARFEIFGRLPGLNEIVAANRSHYHAGAKQKKETTLLCAQYAGLGGVPIFSGPILVIFNWFEPNARRDLDNICGGAKFVLDGLVLAGRIPNDSRKFVQSIFHRFPEPDKKNPRIVVEIEDILVAEKTGGS